MGVIKSMIKQSMLFLAALFFENTATAEQQYEVLTEIFPPYQQYDESSQLTGLSVNLVKKLFNEAKVDYTFLVYPWPRANLITQTKPDTFIFSILKMESRLEEFEWVVPLCRIEVSLYKAKHRMDISINKLSDAKAYRIGVERDQANEVYLETKGFKQGEQLIQVSNNKQLRKMIMVNRVDLILVSNVYIDALKEQREETAINLIQEFTIKDFDKTLFLAANNDTNPALIQKLKHAHSSLLNSSGFSCDK